jgi:hypothetical protein
VRPLVRASSISETLRTPKCQVLPVPSLSPSPSQAEDLSAALPAYVALGGSVPRLPIGVP